MNFLGNSCWVFLIIWILSIIYIGINQGMRMKRVINATKEDREYESFSEMSKGVVSLTIAAVIFYISGILSVISFIIKVFVMKG
jgi:hypothetical protein